jgi:group I intron endonuclease
MRSFGTDNFYIEKIDECATLEEANFKEREYIVKYNSMTPNGYNILEGGDSVPSVLGRKFTDDHKQKLKKAHNLRSKPIIQFNIETGDFIKEWSSGKELLRNKLGRANITVLCKSEKQFGYIYDYGWCYKQFYDSLSDKSILSTKNYNAHGRTIRCLDLEGNLIKIYYKIADAARELNCSDSSILDVLRGRCKTCKGFKWEYFDYQE